jgi:5-methylthioadenosine/S-adenosylhomocysteine deaminase
MELVIEASAAVTMSARGVIKDALIVVESDRIVDVGTKRELKGKYSGYDKLDASSCVVTPGLVNAHTHAAMTLLRGYADDLPLRQWLEQKIWPLEAMMDGESIYIGALLACVESALMGVSSLNTMYHYRRDLNEARAVAEAGLRGFIGHVCFSWRRDEDLKALDDLVARWHGAYGGRIRVTIDPHAPYTVDPSYFKELHQLSLELSEKTGLPVPVHTHLAETEDEAAKVKEAFNVDVADGVVKYLDRLGVLGPWLVAAHCVWLSGREVELLAERGVKVVHCPVSNLKLGAGVAPIPKMLERGVTVALGTDGACSNNVLDLLEAMKLAALLHKGVCRDPSLVKAEEALKMATVNGAAALGLDKSLGKLEPGFKADLVAFDFSHPHLKPLYDEVSHLVYAARSRDVKHMLVDGRLVVEDGVFKVLDVEEVVSKAVKEKEKLMRRLEEAGGRC